METEDVYTLMMEALDGELSEEGWSELESHLRARPALAREWRALQAIDTLFRSAPLLQPAEGFAQRTVARLPSSRQRLWMGVAVYVALLLSGLAPLGAMAWIAIQYLPALFEPALFRSLWKAGGQLLELGGAVLSALLKGAGQLVGQQPALIGWLVVMVGVVALWGVVYHRLVLQPRSGEVG